MEKVHAGTRIKVRASVHELRQNRRFYRSQISHSWQSAWILGSEWQKKLKKGQGATGCDRVRQGATEYNRVRQSATGCDRVRQGATGCDRVRQSVTREDKLDTLPDDFTLF